MTYSPPPKRERAATTALALCRALDYTLDLPVGTIERDLANGFDLNRTPEEYHVDRTVTQKARRRGDHGGGLKTELRIWFREHMGTLRGNETRDEPGQHAPREVER